MLWVFYKQTRRWVIRGKKSLHRFLSWMVGRSKKKKKIALWRIHSSLHILQILILLAWESLRISGRMTSSGLEWDYYEIQPVETSSLEYATPAASSLLLAANPAHSEWSPDAIFDWSMSSHTAPTSEIVQYPVATVTDLKEEKNKKNQRRKASKNPRRSEGDNEVSNLLCAPNLCWASLWHACLCTCSAVLYLFHKPVNLQMLCSLFFHCVGENITCI